MSYWASLEIEMSLLGKRLSAGQFIKESWGCKISVETVNKSPSAAVLVLVWDATWVEHCPESLLVEQIRGVPMVPPPAVAPARGECGLLRVYEEVRAPGSEGRCTAAAAYSGPTYRQVT